MKYWSHHYKHISGDASHNKALVVQSINKEFYNNKEAISGIHIILTNAFYIL